MTNSDNSISFIDITQADISLHIEIAVEQLCEPDWRWDHYPGIWKAGSILILLVHGGETKFRTSLGTYTLRRGDFCIMPSGSNEYHGSHHPDNPLYLTWIICQLYDTAGMPVIADTISGIDFPTKLTNIGFCEQLIKRVVTSPEYSREHWLRSLFDEVRRQMEHSTEKGGDEWIRNLGESIRLQPGRFRNLQSMFRTVPISKDHFIRLFRNYHGLTPGEFLIRARIESAKGMLGASGLSVKEIASRLGYSNAFNFSRQFKARTGVAPLCFRKQRQAR